MIEFSYHGLNLGSKKSGYYPLTGLLSWLTKTNQALRLLVVALGLGFSSNSLALTITGNSELATLDCTSSPCPWGTSISRHGVVWPNTMTTVLNRLGYTATHPIFLSNVDANGAVVTITSGSAALRAGQPDASSHNTLAVLSSGQSHTVSGLLSGDVLWISDLSNFSYDITWPDPTDPPPDPPATGTSSQFVTLNCTSSPCPWGPAVSSNGIVWPDTAATVTNRLGYTASHNAYLQYDYANGSTISVVSGSARLNAGHPDDTSFRSLGTLDAGQSMTVSGLVQGEVLLVHNSSAAFTYEATITEPTGTTDPPPPTGSGTPSEFTTLVCDGGDRCPWGPTPGYNAIVWPASAKPVYHRLDYVADKAMYLPRAYALGAIITVVSGNAEVRAGHGVTPEFRLLASLGAGQSYTVSGLSSGEVISVTSDNSFTYEATITATPPEPVGDVHSSVVTYWRCTNTECSAADTIANSVPWPEWSAYSNNDRTGPKGRTTYGEDGAIIYPYMGSWADGCIVSVISGIAVVIDQWERGSDEWRTTPIGPGETHVISLTAPHNSSLLESWGPFTVAVDNCTPQLVVK